MLEKDEIFDEEDVVSEADDLPEELDVDMVGEEATMKDKLHLLREKLKICEEEKRKHHEELQRTRADFLNSRRRLDEQFERDKERATDKILLDLLTLVDSFDTAMTDKELWNTIDGNWRFGVEAIHTKLLSILKNNQVIPLDPVGETFNPEEHEAVSDIKVSKEDEVEKVLSVLQKGFKRKDTIIRPARVIVGTKE
jgi:molecular chaperone GrpE